MTTPGRIAVVAARYGDGVTGGAESVLRRIAQTLARRGWEVEVLTTTALDHLTGTAHFEAGIEDDDGVLVRRFPARPLNRSRRAHLAARMARGEVLDPAAELDWINADLRSPELFHHLLAAGPTVDLVLLGPSTTWVAVAGAQAVGTKAVLWACIHDEPLARFALAQTLFSGSRLLLQTDPEHALAHRLVSRLGPHAVVGCPVPIPVVADPEGFRRRHGIDVPFVLYAGRREGAKGWDNLLAGFAHAVRDHDVPFTLVTMGAGEVQPPADIASRVIDLGHVADDERDSAMAAAAAYVQPSTLEAFSMSVMEAWLAGTLVIANAGGEVVRWHCERSGAGLLYADDHQLGECLAFLAAEPDAARAIASSGRGYVLEHYAEKAVMDRIEHALQSWRA